MTVTIADSAAPEGGSMGAPAAAAEMPQELSKYELLCPLASGGMAQLYLARTTGLAGFEKLVVVKRILPEFATNASFVTMLLDEARIAATLQHANVVQVYDVGSASGTVFFAMEFLHGHDLKTVLARALSRGRRIPLGQAVAIVLSVCSGLHYAHSKTGPRGQPLGIVHRDVSPHNVFSTYDGLVKVIDFGIAKAADRLSRTHSGVLKGKFGYMSPEQCQSRPLDARSDVFCIAILLYELTTGTRLFAGDNEYEVLKAVVETDPVAPSTRVADYPADLEAIVMKGLSRAKNARYPSALHMQKDLEAFAQRYKLDVSQFGVAQLMAELFEPELASWRDAQSEGRGLADHVSAVVARRGHDAPHPARPEAIDANDDLQPITPKTSTVAKPPMQSWAWPALAIGAVFTVVAAWAAFAPAPSDHAATALPVSATAPSSAPLAAPLPMAEAVPTAPPEPERSAPMASAPPSEPRPRPKRAPPLPSTAPKAPNTATPDLDDLLPR
jgi:serine/threonine protein kinase